MFFSPIFSVNHLLGVKYCHDSGSAINRDEVWSLCFEYKSCKIIKRASKIKGRTYKCNRWWGREARCWGSLSSVITQMLGNHSAIKKKKGGGEWRGAQIQPLQQVSMTLLNAEHHNHVVSSANLRMPLPAEENYREINLDKMDRALDFRMPQK